jgi:hypothetical protein
VPSTALLAYFESPSGLQNALQSAEICDILYDGMPDTVIGEVIALPAEG